MGTPSWHSKLYDKESKINRIRGLDLLRTVAILWVMWIHLNFPVMSAMNYGWMGVDLFFVLSGYLIGSQLFKQYKQNNKILLTQFYLNRSMRILPAYLVVVVLYFAVPGFTDGPMNPLWQFLTFVANLFSDFQNHIGFVITWSLCIEEQFYFLFPIILILLIKKTSLSSRTILIFFLSFVIFGLLVRTGMWLHYIKSVQNLTNNLIATYHDKIYFPTYSRLDGLLAGVMLATIKYFRPQLWQSCMRYSNVIFFIGILGFILSLMLFKERYALLPAIFGYPLISISFALITLAATNPASLIGSVKIPFTTTIATLAYSLYLTHQLTFRQTALYFPSYVSGGGWKAVGVYAAASLIVAAILYLCVERPFLILRDKIINRSKDKDSKVYSVDNNFITYPS